MKKLLDAAIVLAAAALLLVGAIGGIDVSWGPLAIRLHAWSRPFFLLAALLAARFWIAPFNLEYVATRGLAALLLAVVSMYATYQVRVCGGLDSYGYVSASSLLASGHLIQPQPLVKYLPFERASDAAAPLGYIAGRDGQTELPRFPLGLPAVMAVFRIFGPSGPFFVPLVMGVFTIGLAFLIARDLPPAPSSSVALLAAALVAIDPLQFDYAIQPMSDVPAACWLLAAVWLMLRGGSEGGSKRTRPTYDREYVGRVLLDPAIAGLCAGMAFFTRPALMPAALAIAIVTLDRPWKETARYLAATAVFVVLQMAINATLYGSIVASGYGPASVMFKISPARLAENVSNYGKWLTHSHSFLIWLIWPVSLAVLRRQRWAWQLSAIAAAAAAPYLFYLVFDDWESGRFLLPAVLLVLILGARALGALLNDRAVTGAVVLAAGLAAAAASNRFMQNEGVYRFGDVEAKYLLAGRWVDAHIPSNAVVFAALHSGSLRYYGHRQTIRWDQIPSDRMSITLHNLTAAGYAPYLALDSTADEPMLFNERFAGDPAVRIEPIDRVRVVNFYRFVP